MLILNTIDREIMQGIHDNSFPTPDLSDRLYIAKKTIIENGQVVAIGLVRLTAEGILITNQVLPKTTRARCSATAIESLKQDVKCYGMNECHIFVKDNKVKKFLQHLGFVSSKGGDPLVINF